MRRCVSMAGAARAPLRRWSTAQPEDPTARLALVTTCGKCDAPIRKTFSKIAYTKGVVLVKCPGCGVRHLIADHLGWFDHLGVRSLEDQYGDRLRRGKLEDYLVLEADSGDVSAEPPAADRTTKD